MSKTTKKKDPLRLFHQEAQDLNSIADSLHIIAQSTLRNEKRFVTFINEVLKRNNVKKKIK